MADKSLDRESVVAGFLFGLEIYDHIRFGLKADDLGTFWQQLRRVIRELAESESTITDTDAEVNLLLDKLFPSWSSDLRGDLLRHCRTKQGTHRELARLVYEHFRGFPGT